MSFLRGAWSLATRAGGGLFRRAPVTTTGLGADWLLNGGGVTRGIVNAGRSLVSTFNAVSENLGTLPTLGIAAAAIGVVGYLANNLVGGAMNMALTVGAVALGGYALSQTEMGQNLMARIPGLSEPTA